MLPQLREVELTNGFRALLVERKTLPIVSSMLWYNVGSRDERSDETGVSHFLEHMMFKGTDKFGKGVIDQLTGKMVVMKSGSNSSSESRGTRWSPRASLMPVLRAPGRPMFD